MFDQTLIVRKTYKKFYTIRNIALIYIYTIISIFLGHPSSPPRLDSILFNEGFEMRRHLDEKGVKTPKLFSITENEILEEFIENGDLHSIFRISKDMENLSYKAGEITATLHKIGYSIIDNKSQNFLTRKKGEEITIYKIDLGFIRRSKSAFSKSIDIASFLSSIMDLDVEYYTILEKKFLEGYSKIVPIDYIYLVLVLRNILAIGISENKINMFKNIMKRSALNS